MAVLKLPAPIEYPNSLVRCEQAVFCDGACSGCVFRDACACLLRRVVRCLPRRVRLLRRGPRCVFCDTPVNGELSLLGCAYVACLRVVLTCRAYVSFSDSSAGTRTGSCVSSVSSGGDSTPPWPCADSSRAWPQRNEELPPRRSPRRTAAPSCRLHCGCRRRRRRFLQPRHGARGRAPVAA